MVLTCTQIFAVLDAQSEQNQDLSPVLDVSSLLKKDPQKVVCLQVHSELPPL